MKKSIFAVGTCSVIAIAAFAFVMNAKSHQKDNKKELTVQPLKKEIVLPEAKPGNDNTKPTPDPQSQPMRTPFPGSNSNSSRSDTELPTIH